MMHRKGFLEVVLVAIAVVGWCIQVRGAGAEDVLTVDFSQRAGKIRPELFSSGLGGQLIGPQSARIGELSRLHLYSARTHDWALFNPGQRMLDTHFVFPLLHADTEDERNYFFGPTDEILRQTIEQLGLHVMYRMGTSIESVNDRRKKREWMGQADSSEGAEEWAALPGFYNCVEPADWDQYAKALSHIIRHYTRGWAKGFRWGCRMEYWELWNEPNDRPGGSWINKDMSLDRAANGERFNSFFVYVLKRLKAEFPELKFGGPAMCSFGEPFLRKLLEKCREEGYVPDFISWHGYGDSPDVMLKTIPLGRRICDEYGFLKTELVINEWHYIPYKTVWLDFGKGPKKYAEIMTGENGLTSVEAGVYALQVFIGVQDSVLGQCFYYGAGHNYGNPWGIRKSDGSLNKTFYALEAFGDVVKNCVDRVRVTGLEKGGIRVFGGVSANGDVAKLLVTDYRPAETSFSIEVLGLERYRLVGVRLLDRVHDLESSSEEVVKLSGTRYCFRHQVPGSAAWVLSFVK